jgi:ATP-dependent RNA helicase DeaD
LERGSFQPQSERPVTDPTNPAVGEPENPLPETTLDDLPERLRAAVARAGWTSLMPVQARAIPYLLAGRDMIVQARTGSGKTGAFLLPMLERLDSSARRCQALVLVPTRELARQVAQDAQTLCAEAGIESVVVYGGVGYREQTEALRGGVQLVIGTPGRVLDHLLKRNLNLEHLSMLIFDEADRMLSMGFYPDMRRLQRYLPGRGLQSCMFSATFPAYVLRVAREFIQEPDFLTLSRGQVHVSDVEHVYFEVPEMDKDRSLVRIIEMDNPASAIIFCNTKVRVHYVSVVLQRFGYDADELSADLSQQDRERVLERVRQGTLRFLVATDVAARGLDIPELSHVFQYEPPEDAEAYIHRAGRTGRAGASGVVVSLVSGIERLALKRIAQRFTIDLQERPLPSDEDVAAVVSERVTALLEARLRSRDKLQAERSARFVPLARELAESEDESAIIGMLLDDYYQQAQHGPLIPPPERSGPPESARGGGAGARRPRPRGRH